MNILRYKKKRLRVLNEQPASLDTEHPLIKSKPVKREVSPRESTLESNPKVINDNS